MTTAIRQFSSPDGKIAGEYDDDAHTYLLSTPAIGIVPSVTGILGAFDKPLLPWVERVTCEGVARMHRYGCDAIFSDPRKLRDALHKNSLGHQQIKESAGKRRGTPVHKTLEAWVQEGRVPSASDLASDNRGYILAFGGWLQAHEPHFEASEVIVASAQHRYAGTYDAKASITKRCGEKTCGCARIEPGAVGRVDYKTSKRVYEFEVFAQLDGYEIAAREMGESLAPWRAVLRLGRNGKFEFVASPEPFGHFLPLLEAYKVKQRSESRAKPWRGGRR